MLCPYCGAENAEGTTFCRSCGYDIISNSQAVENAPKASPVTRRRNPRRRKKGPGFLNFRTFLIAAVGLIALVIGITLLASALEPNNGYHAYEQNILVEIVDGEVMILQDAKKAKPSGLSARTIEKHLTSMDGRVVAILTDENTLAVIRNRKLTVVAEDVVSFNLSVDGTGLAYTTETDNSFTLTLYNVRTKKAKVITDELLGSYELSPDGDSVAYFTRDDAGERKLMFFNGSKSSLITTVQVSMVGTPNMSLLGISNDGKYIYAVVRDDGGVKNLYCYNKKGERQMIGPCNISTVFFNADHTQVLYYNSNNGYQTYISTDGGEAELISSAVASPLMPDNCKTFTVSAIGTYPVDDLYGKVYLSYQDGAHDVWFMHKNTGKRVLLASGIYKAVISENAETLYCFNGDELSVLKISDGEKASKKGKMLAQEVGIFLVTSDGKYVYYTSGSTLYSVNAKNGKGKKTVAENIQSDLYSNADDIVYYMFDNDLYASQNGKKGKLVLSDAESLFSSENGIVYVFMNDDSLYATSGAKKPSLVWSED